MKIGFVLFLISNLATCQVGIDSSYMPSEITKEIEGEYIFTYPTGHLEVLKINLDSSYSKIVYKNVESYNLKSDPLFYNEGKWSSSGKKIRFNKWLMCNDYINPNTLLKEPYQTNLLDIYWHESNDKLPASFLLLDEPFYEFKKKASATSLPNYRN